MESQGKRWAAEKVAVWEASYAGRESSRSGVTSVRTVLRWLLASLLFLSLGAVQAQGSSPAPANAYVYDAHGRLLAITKSDGTSTAYTYDALGNLLQVGSPLAAGQLALFAFSPAHGNVGTAVTIQGQGFSSTLANDSVSFNGSIATVVSATTTQLVTNVPSGASTGPIMVTVGGQTVSSAASFVVDDTGLPPIITQVTPAIVAVGGTVTVTGTHLDPVPGNTAVQMGGQSTALSATSDSQLQFAVSNTSISGYVVAQTPYGQATSATSVVVLPSGLSAASVVSSGNATINGAPVALNIAAAGQTGAVTFDAAAGSWVSLQASAISTTNSISYTIYAPGNVVIQQGAVSTISPTIHLPQLSGGTYLAVFQPSVAGVQLNVGVEANVALATNVPATIATTVQGQSKRLVFQAIAGQSLTFEVNNATTVPAGQAVTYTAYAPNGASYSTTISATTGVINLGNLPTMTTGTYQVVIAPGRGVTGTIQVELLPGVAGTLPESGAPQSYTTAIANQNAYLSFTANQGDSLQLTLAGLTLSGSTSASVAVNVYSSSGASIASTSCFPSNPGGSCRLPLWSLVAGSYSVVVSPASNSGTMNFQAILEPDVIGPALVANTPQVLTLGAGQTERLTFNASAGSTVALNLSGVSTTPTGQSMNVYVYRPDIGTITASNSYTSTSSTGSSTTLNLQNLPVTGTYIVRVYTTYGEPGSAQLTVATGVTGTLSTTGTTQSYATTVSNQNAYLSFTATPSANLELALSGLTITGSSSTGVSVNVLNASGTNIASTNCYTSNPGNDCRLPLWNLVAGIYSVVISPPNASSTISFNAAIGPDVVGPMLAANTPATVSLGAGQVERLTFSANAGDTVALNLSGVSTTPSGQTVYAYVYRPDNGAIVSGNSPYAYVTSSGSGSTLNLPNLPVSGNYTVIVYTTYGNPASAQLTLVSGAVGTLSSNGTSQSYASTAVNQNVYLSFTANQGDTLQLTLTGLAISGSSANAAYVNVLNASGTNIASTTCYTSNPGNDCRLALWNLAAGTYSVVVSPPNASSTISFNTLLEPEVAGPALTVGSPTSVSLGTGQVERLTFTANAGDTVAMSLSGVSTTPIGQTVYANVYRPDTGVITSSNTYATTSSSGSSATLNLPNLPASGTYIVRVYTTYGEPGSAQLTLVSDVSAAPPVYSTPTLPDNGVQQSEAGAAAGQNVMMSFNANQGDTLQLTLSGLTITGSSASSAAVNVVGPSGTSVASTTCYTSNPGNSCRLPLWNLTAGTYSVTVSPPNASSTISFNAVLGPDVVGPVLATNTPTTVTLGTGQAERLTFNATAGSTVALNLSSVSTTPTGQSVYAYVYRPDTGTITSTNSYTYTSSAGSNTTLNLPNLPASGTYTVRLYTTYGEPGTAQVTLVSGVTGTLTANQASQSYTTTVANQTVNLSFAANQGDNLELVLTGLAVSGSSSNSAGVSVYSATGTNVGSTSCYTSNPGNVCRVTLWDLAAGTYSVVVSPPNASSTISVNAMLLADDVGSTLTVNTPTSITLGTGLIKRLTFTANAGDTLALNLSGGNTTPSGYPVRASVYRPDVGAITSSTPVYTYVSSTAGSSTTVNLQNLPVSGTYTVVVYTVSYGEPGSAQLTLTSGVTGTLTTNGSPQSYANTITNQNIYLSFAANPGDNLELTFNQLSAGTFTESVYNAAGTQIAGFSCTSSNPGASCIQPLWSLEGGIYSVVVTPNSSSGMTSFNALLQRDTVGPALALNTPTTVTLGAGQTERLTFSANAGDTVGLNLSAVSTTPAGQTVYANVYRPDTGAITSSSSYYASANSNGSSTTLNLPNLPVSGSYTVVVPTPYGDPATAQLLLLPGATGTLISAGTSHSYTTTAANQTVNLSFAANQGDNLEMTLNGITVTGSNATLVGVGIYNSSDAYVTGTTCRTSDPGSGCRLPLWNMPSGTYSVLVWPPDTVSTISFNAMLESDLVGAVLAANTPMTVNLGTGQVQRVTFNANVGNTVVLNLSGVSTTPSGQTVYVDVYQPNTGAITTANYYAYFDSSGSSATLNLPNLPASGAYTALIYTSYGQPGSAQLTLVPQ